MYLFSINATSSKDQGEFKAGEECPFIVYINFLDLFGAEQLAKLYLMKEGFRDATIVKRRFIKLDGKPHQDPQIQEAQKKGYCLQVFSAH
ncbi:hypothetical protein FHR99_002985 [Litorivivens lipolytica]|uniref:Uncharacterized protein n=1 Tax=Litorivivens lipolytica TaxID=1524264 RepID=A0A7W4W757_9GAMM|nr:hypothetical protein [Litorivivens lipolytica]MBB3048711.1 hypothetical protein [Litorivivens lipolytica]